MQGLEMGSWRKVLLFFVGITPALHILKHHANTLTYPLSHTNATFSYISNVKGRDAMQRRIRKKKGESTMC
jgi:hypothetical protein